MSGSGTADLQFGGIASTTSVSPRIFTRVRRGLRQMLLRLEEEDADEHGRDLQQPSGANAAGDGPMAFNLDFQVKNYNPYQTSSGPSSRRSTFGGVTCFLMASLTIASLVFLG